MRSDRLAATVVAGLCFAATGCSEPKSYVMLSLQTSMPAPITNVINIQVVVTDMLTNEARPPLTYDAGGAMIDQVTVNTLSVGFGSNETGTFKFDVDALNNAGCSIGHGSVTRDIVKGNVAKATVYLVAGTTCSNVDGGAPDGGEGGVVLPGCDVVNPQSTDPSVTTCAAGQVCQVCGFSTDPSPRNVCVAGGTRAAGMACDTNADCQPGTQCFDYMLGTNAGCAVKLCLAFCNDNAGCATFGASGTGPGSFCQGPVMCPTVLTSYHTCTFNCDPRAAAAATRGGCPTGLICVMPGAMDQVDCACREPTRTKTEGQDCTQAADCAPGLICNRMGATQTCRPICRCDANASSVCTATPNDCPTAGTTCHAVTNATRYGICL